MALEKERDQRRTYKGRKVLEAVGVCAAHADGTLVPQHEGDLNDAGKSSRHQGVPEDRMDHSADHQGLRMRRHSISSQQDDNGRNKVALWPAIPAAAQPYAQQTGAPPDHPHRGMLQIIMDPRTTPAVLGKGIDTAPGGDDERVKELLAATRPAQPVLTNQQKNSQTNPVSDKRTAHDKVCQTLAEVVTLTEAHGRNAAKEHLRPTDDGHDLPDNPMS